MTVKSVLLVFAAFVAGASQAGWESWLRKASFYHASFEDYYQNQDLSDAGADGGTWGTIPAGAEAKAASEDGVGMVMQFSTDATGLVFTPDSSGDRALKSVMTSVRMLGWEDYPPQLPSSARGSIGIYAPEGGAACFIGWTSAGWTNLFSSTVRPVQDEWYDVSMKFLQQTNGVACVQYRLKRLGDPEYATLHAADGEDKSWFAAGGSSSGGFVSKVEYQGEGAFRYLTGSEPRRGMLIGLVPWREMFIDETVHRHGTGKWYVFDYDFEQWIERPNLSDDGDAYAIDVPEGENYASFKPQEKESVDGEVVEFAVRFLAPNDNDAMPTNEVCALVRLVEDYMPDVKAVGLACRFACLAGGKWVTTAMEADVNADYTVEVRLNKKKDPQTVSYRVKKGRGAEAGAYQDLVKDVPVTIDDPLFTFFGGVGMVYSIKSAGQTAK